MEKGATSQGLQRCPESVEGKEMDSLQGCGRLLQQCLSLFSVAVTEYPNLGNL